MAAVASIELPAIAPSTPAAKGLIRPLALVAQVSTLGATALVSSVARADDPRLLPPLTMPTVARDALSQATGDPWTTRRASVLASGGTGGPLGYGGLSFEYSPWRYLVLGGGVGIQPGGGTGAFTWRLRLPLNRYVAIGLGVPLSTGPYQWVGSYVAEGDCAGGVCGSKVTRTWGWTTWVHIEPSVEFRIANGIALRAYGGRSFMIDPSSGVCTSDGAGGCPSSGGETQWYAGLAAGVAF